MTQAAQSAAIAWAEMAIEKACDSAERWYRTLPTFHDRVNLGSVVGFRHPAILSEQDCVMHFARFLNEAGVAWDAIHHQVAVSRWLFAAPHEAATAGAAKWRVDLALLRSEDFLAAQLPATGPGFSFDACLEFAYLPDFWTLPDAAKFGEPEKGHAKVQQDVEKIARYLNGGVSAGSVTQLSSRSPTRRSRQRSNQTPNPWAARSASSAVIPRGHTRNGGNPGSVPHCASSRHASLDRTRATPLAITRTARRRMPSTVMRQPRLRRTSRCAQEHARAVGDRDELAPGPASECDERGL
jgi:hypothetical protein